MRRYSYLMKLWRWRSFPRLARSFSSNTKDLPVVFKVGKPVPLIYPWMKKWKPLEMVAPFETPAERVDTEEDTSEDEATEHVGKGRKRRRRLVNAKKTTQEQVHTKGICTTPVKLLEEPIVEVDDELPVDSADEAGYDELARLVDEEDRGASNVEDSRYVSDEEVAGRRKNSRKLSKAVAPHPRDEGDRRRLQEIIEELEHEGMLLDSAGYGSLLQWCGNTKSLELGNRVLVHMKRTHHNQDRYVRNTIMEMYGKCGELKEARAAFEGIRKKNVFSWTIMVSAYAQNGHYRDALQVLGLMDLEGERPNAVTFVNALGACGNLKALQEGRLLHEGMAEKTLDSNLIAQTALLNMYSKCSSLTDARRVFGTMRRRDIVSYNAMMAAYSQLTHGKESLELFQRMEQEGTTPNEMTYGSVLNACEKLLALNHGKAVHSQIAGSRFESDVVVATALVSLYGKCGKLRAAREVFRGMRNRNVVTWTAMISAFVQSGRWDEAVETFRRMDVQPDEVTLATVLAACDAEEGRKLFSSMETKYGVKPLAEHYSSMVESLGRSGSLEEAEKLIQESKNVGNWMTFLSVCRRHGDMERSARAADKVLDLDTGGSFAPYATLREVYRAAGKLEEAEERLVNLAGMRSSKKHEVGRSWIEVKNRVHEFSGSEDGMSVPFSHPHLQRIHEELRRLGAVARESGDLVESAKCCHSERLAVGFGAISTPEKTKLRVVKNVKVCYECHAFLKAVSKVTGRRIVVRDAQQFHNFENGHCSC